MKHRFNLIRLAAVPLSLTLISILAGSVINRVMVVELGLPVTLAGLFLAVPLLVAPVRVWLGHRSDAYPIRGLRREPYIIIGAGLAGLGAAVSVALVLRTESLLSVGAAATLLFLIVYGIGKNLTSNTFQALLADKFEEGAPRSRAATLYEVVNMIGLIAGAGIVGATLQPYTPERLTVVVAVIGGMALLFALFAAPRQEPRDVADRGSQEARSQDFRTIVKQVVMGNPQVRRFFVVVMLTLLGTQIQDVLLEPYAAVRFGMTVGESSQLTAFWGLGTLIAMLASGLYLIKRFGYLRIYRIGLGVVAVMFLVIVAIGFTGNANLLRLAVVFLGLGTGLAAASLLVSMIEFTTEARAGLLIGVWGVAHQLGRAMASLLGGLVVDSLLSVSGGNEMLAYGTAFVLETILVIVAIGLIAKVDVAEAKASVARIGAWGTAVPTPTD
ncbi:BCD family MFS transporter [Candidatus Leptofilum sp.]|uniref:BCD family MFS transporter n=1 Tax=Candidatus Leptofilum sp. TaxID=3241576 RepID=UPI003B5A552E